LNVSNEDIVLNNGQLVAEALPFEEEHDKLPDNKPDTFDEQIKNRSFDHLKSDEKLILTEMLAQKQKAFSTKEEPLGHITCVKHKLETTPGVVAFSHPYTLKKLIH
jgi:hypothetical protein